jgi:hypothetical protein
MGIEKHHNSTKKLAAGTRIFVRKRSFPDLSP